MKRLVKEKEKCARRGRAVNVLNFYPNPMKLMEDGFRVSIS